MLYEFKCKVAGTVVMTQPVAERLLAIIGKPPAPAGVQALCTTRAGGVSQGPYASMNLGTHVGDDPQAVQTNRARLQAALGQSTPGARPVFLSQVHGTGVAALTASTPDNTEADACVATDAGVVCTIMVADCLPVLLTDRQGTRVGAAHCGWRGLAGAGQIGILETFFESIWHDPSTSLHAALFDAGDRNSLTTQSRLNLGFTDRPHFAFDGIARLVFPRPQEYKIASSRRFRS